MIPLPTRLAVRIYLVTVVAVLGPALAVFLLVKLLWAPPRHEPFPGIAQYAASKLAQRWPSTEGLREELTALRAQAGIAGAVYRWDDTLVAADGTNAGPLSCEELDRLGQAGVMERGRDGEGGPGPRPSHAIALERDGARVGYVILEPAGPPHGRPPPPGALPFLFVLVALGVAAAVLGSTIARPLGRLAQAAHALGSGDLSARTGIDRRDEVGEVARAFDDMADRVVGLLRAQTELLANVAHELRTPLARIRVALDLAEGADAAAARESLAEIATDLGELERLVDDILATARMDLAQNTTGDGALPLRRSRVAVEDVVAGAIQRLAQAHPGRRVEARVDPGLPALEGDPVLLRRALDNLLDNARKYSAPETKIGVRAARRGDELVLQVIDRGEGMSREDLERLFAPFFRADRSRARRTGGVGLGLTLTRRIVEAHGGSVRAESTPGVGTTMTVVLPLPASGEAAAPRTRTT